MIERQAQERKDGKMRPGQRSMMIESNQNYNQWLLFHCEQGKSMLRKVTPCALVSSFHSFGNKTLLFFRLHLFFCRIMDQDIEEIDDGPQLSKEQNEHIDNFMSCTGMFVAWCHFSLITN